MDPYLGDCIEFNARKFADKAALVFRDRRITYSELERRVNRLAGHLLSMGIDKGDRVAYILMNGNAAVELFYAIVRIGAIAVPINFRLIAREVKFCVDYAGARVLVYSDETAKSVDPVKADLPSVQYVVRSGAAAPEGERHFEALEAEGDEAHPRIAIAFDDPAALIFTGGTTGIPKAATHTHRTYYFSVVGGAMQSQCCNSSEVVLTQAPIFHIGGLTLVARTFLVGGTAILLETYDVERVLRLIESERVTNILLLPPTSYVRLLDSPAFARHDVSSVTRIVSSAGAFPNHVMLRVFDAFPNASIQYGYGQSESLLCTYMSLTRELIEQDLPRARSVGCNVPFMEMRLVDESGSDVPLGEVGEAIVRGPHTMIGYWGHPELTKQTLRDGWIWTGDLLRKDVDGYYYFMGRSKDMIKTGGENVFALEVEKVIMSLPAVEICSIVGVPDPTLGEAILAVVKVRDGYQVTDDEIVEHCKSQLAGYKKPRRVVFTDQFPVSDAGKIQKFKLVEQFGGG